MELTLKIFGNVLTPSDSEFVPLTDIVFAYLQHVFFTTSTGVEVGVPK
jgi:hypothetical protein